MNKKEILKETKRLQKLLNEKNAEKATYIDDIFEQIKKAILEFESLFDEYRNLLYPDVFSGKKELTEAEEKNERDLIKRMNDCIERISRAVGAFERIFESNGRLYIRNIDEANNNFVDIAGTYDYVKKRYKLVKNETKKVSNLFDLLQKSITSLDSNIQDYNAQNETELYTIGTALYVFNQESPK